MPLGAPVGVPLVVSRVTAELLDGVCVEDTGDTINAYGDNWSRNRLIIDWPCARLSCISAIKSNERSLFLGYPTFAGLSFFAFFLPSSMLSDPAHEHTDMLHC